MLIEILKFSFMKMRLKVSSVKWRLFCLGLNELTCWGIKIHICASELNYHWFRWRLVDYLAPKYNLNQCKLIANWTLRRKFGRISIKMTKNIFRVKWFWKCCLLQQNDDFIRALICYPNWLVLNLKPIQYSFQYLSLIWKFKHGVTISTSIIQPVQNSFWPIND